MEETKLDGSQTKNELAQFHSEMKNRSAGKKGSSEDESGEAQNLPVGAATVEEGSAEQEAGAEAAPAQDNASDPGESRPKQQQKELIKIGEREFETQEEAIKYAEQLESERLVAEAYNQGIRDHINATQAPAQVPPQEEDKFEEEFYSNPKETLKKIEDRATQRALSLVQAESRREGLWNKFFSKYPDLEGHRWLCETTLERRKDIILNIKDEERAMKVLATETRKIFQDYNERTKPATELKKQGGQAVSAGSGTAPGVTPAKKESRPLTLSEQLRSLKK